MKKFSPAPLAISLCLAACGGDQQVTAEKPTALPPPPAVQTGDAGTPPPPPVVHPGDTGTAVPDPVVPAPPDAPFVQSISGTSIAVGASFTITGRGLDRVERYELGTATLRIVSASPTSATLRMPMQPVSGTLILINGTTSLNSGFTLNAYVPLAVTNMQPDTGIEGTSVTLTGTGLDGLVGVTFANDRPATILSRHGASSVTVLVPPGAQSGPLIFDGSYNRASSAAAFTVLSRPAVTGIGSVSEGDTLLIDIDGQSLDAVTSASVGQARASIVSTSATRLRLSVPLGSTGAISLNAPGRPTLLAGTIGDYTIAGINISQVFNREAGSSALKATAGKAMAVHAAILTSGANQTAPEVTLSASAASGASLGSLKMNGPAVLPEKKEDYKLSSNFNAVLPAQWVQPGLTLRVTVAGAGSVAVSQSAKPAVSVAPKIDLVLVPLTSDSGTGALPSLARIRNALARLYPYSPADISVRVREAMPHPGDSTTTAWWNSALGAVELLRTQESPAAYYYGLVNRPRAAPRESFTAGLAYKNERLAVTPKTSGIGVDNDYGGWEPPPGPVSDADRRRLANEEAAMRNDAFDNKWPTWLSTMMHELGHVHSLQHANCGGRTPPDDPDLTAPYPLGELGPLPLYDSLYNDGLLGNLSKPEVNGVVMKDVMSYCSGTWFSDHSYKGVQQFLANRLALQQRAKNISALISGDTSDYLTLSGQITSAGVVWRPAVATGVRLQDTPHGGQAAYTLRVRSTAGQTFDVPFDTVALDHGTSGESDFTVSLPNPGGIASISVLNRQQGLLTQTPGKLVSTGTATLSWTQNNGKLDLQWNAAAEPYVSVVYVATNGARKVLAPALRGGSASLDVGAAKAGGIFEVSLATQFSARLVRVAVK